MSPEAGPAPGRRPGERSRWFGDACDSQGALEGTAATLQALQEGRRSVRSGVSVCIAPQRRLCWVAVRQGAPRHTSFAIAAPRPWSRSPMDLSGKRPCEPDSTVKRSIVILSWCLGSVYLCAVLSFHDLSVFGFSAAVQGTGGSCLTVGVDPQRGVRVRVECQWLKGAQASPIGVM